MPANARSLLSMFHPVLNAIYAVQKCYVSIRSLKEGKDKFMSSTYQNDCTTMPRLPLAVFAEQAVMAQWLLQLDRALFMQQLITAATAPQLRNTGTSGTHFAALSCRNLRRLAGSTWIFEC